MFRHWPSCCATSFGRSTTSTSRTPKRAPDHAEMSSGVTGRRHVSCHSPPRITLASLCATSPDRVRPCQSVNVSCQAGPASSRASAWTRLRCHGGRVDCHRPLTGSALGAWLPRQRVADVPERPVDPHPSGIEVEVGLVCASAGVGGDTVWAGLRLIRPRLTASAIALWSAPATLATVFADNGRASHPRRRVRGRRTARPAWPASGPGVGRSRYAG